MMLETFFDGFSHVVPTVPPSWQGLYTKGSSDGHAPSWQLAAYPLPLPDEITAKLLALGESLQWFLETLDQLYEASWKQTSPDEVPSWVAQWLDQGKPEAIIALARHKKQKQHQPLVIRPDLLWGTDNHLTLCEIDAIPGGLGFTQALQSYYHAHCPEGMPYAPFVGMPFDNDASCGASYRMAHLWLQAIRASIEVGLSPKRQQACYARGQCYPYVVICISDEATDYKEEWHYWVETALGGFAKSGVVCLHPKDLFPQADGLYFHYEGEAHRVDVLYRFFECFDVASLPQSELILHAIKKQWLVCTPPVKPHLEEKLMSALWHHPILRPFWERAWKKAYASHPALKETMNVLDTLIPLTWVLDPAPLPASAVYTPTLNYQGKPLNTWDALKKASQKERHWVIKPSGFSPEAWGSRGVVIGHDHASEYWAEAIDHALHSFSKTPHVLQPYHKPQVIAWHTLHFKPMPTVAAPQVPAQALEPVVEPFEARIRLCPYYIVHPVTRQVTLAGVLATGCPKDKKIIHGMKDAILAPVSLASSL
ncbi:MAG: hypothetical protein ACKO37_09775 [Vampirovibrionales bacterium]